MSIKMIRNMNRINSTVRNNHDLWFYISFRYILALYLIYKGCYNWSYLSYHTDPSNTSMILPRPSLGLCQELCKPLSTFAFSIKVSFIVLNQLIIIFFYGYFDRKVGVCCKKHTCWTRLKNKNSCFITSMHRTDKKGGFTSEKKDIICCFVLTVNSFWIPLKFEKDNYLTEQW